MKSGIGTKNAQIGKYLAAPELDTRKGARRLVGVDDWSRDGGSRRSGRLARDGLSETTTQNYPDNQGQNESRLRGAKQFHREPYLSRLSVKEMLDGSYADS
jgi:hypothetical protein